VRAFFRFRASINPESPCAEAIQLAGGDASLVVPARSAVSQIHVMLVNASKWVPRPLYLLITVYRNNSGTYQSRSVDRLPDLLV
jgi:hypothetical protein